MVQGMQRNAPAVRRFHRGRARLAVALHRTGIDCGRFQLTRMTRLKPPARAAEQGRREIPRIPRVSRRSLVPRVRRMLFRCILCRHVGRLFLGCRLRVRYRCERCRHPRFWCDRNSRSDGCSAGHGGRRTPNRRRGRPVRRRRVGSVAFAHCGLDEPMKRGGKDHIDAEATSKHGEDRPSTPRGSQIHRECPQKRHHHRLPL